MRTFKQDVILALLSNMEWMPKFHSTEACAEYLSEDVPGTTAESIALHAKAIAVLVDLTATEINNLSGSKETQ